MGVNGAQSSREEVLGAIRAGERFFLTTHEKPDGDAVGSLAGMQQVLTALGKDAVAFLAADELPLPYEYRFIELQARRVLHAQFAPHPALEEAVGVVERLERTAPLPGVAEHRHVNARMAKIRRCLD